MSWTHEGQGRRFRWCDRHACRNAPARVSADTDGIRPQINLIGALPGAWLGAYSGNNIGGSVRAELGAHHGVAAW